MVETFAQALAREMAAHGDTQYSLAQKAGVAVNVPHSHIHGKRPNPNIDTFIKYARVYPRLVLWVAAQAWDKFQM